MPNFEDQFDIEVESPQGAIKPATPEQTMAVLDDEESALLYTGSSVNLQEFTKDPTLAGLVGRGLTDSIANYLVVFPAVTSQIVGKKMDDQTYGPLKRTAEQVEEWESGPYLRIANLIPIWRLPPQKLSAEELVPNPPTGKSLETRVGEKMRNFGIAMQQKMALEKETRDPKSFIEKSAYGLGNMVASLAATLGGGAVGATLGARFGPQGAALGSVVGMGVVSFNAEKAVLSQQLLDAGFGSDAIDRFSTYYAAPVAGFDVWSAGTISMMYRPVALQAVKSAAGRMAVSKALKMSATKTGQVAAKFIEAASKEGPTEMLQNRIQTEFEVGLKLRDRDFWNDLTDDVVALTVGSFTGGTTGAASQINYRRDTIKRIAKKHNLPRDVVAVLHDDAVLNTHNRMYDVLIQQADVSQQMNSIDKAFAKIEGHQAQVSAEPVEDPITAQAFAASADLIDAESILVDAKTKELRSQVNSLRLEQRKINEQIVAEKAVKSAEEIAKSKVKLEGISARLEKAQVQYQEALAGNPKLQKLEQQLSDARLELMQKDPEAIAEFEQEMGDIDRETDIYRIIRSEGGVAPHKKGLAGALNEEYRENVPIHLRNRKGKTLDEMAASLAESHPELGITDTASLLEVLSNRKLRGGESKTSLTPGTPEEVQALKDKMAALEARIQGIQSPEETVKLAEQKVTKIQGTLLTTFEQLLELEAINTTLRIDPTLAFTNEMGRAPTDKAELSAWSAQKEAEVRTERSVLQREAERLTKQVLAAEQQLEAFEQGLARVTGKVELNASQVRQMAARDLRNVLIAFRSGVKVSEQSVKGIQRAFTSLLSRVKLSNKAKTLLLRKVLTIRNAQQFNDRIGPIVESINTVLRTETVGQLQELGRRVLDKMQPGKTNVSPQMQLFAEHLKLVYTGRAPLNHDINSSDPLELAKAVVEQAAYDLHNAGDDVGAAMRSFTTLQEFFRDGLQRYADFKASKQATYDRVTGYIKESVGKGLVVDKAKEALDAARQKIRRAGLSLGSLATPFVRSFLSILDRFDAHFGKPTLEGPLVKEFMPTAAHEVLMIHNRWARDSIDGKLQEIYGDHFLEIWKGFIGEDFLNVPVTDETGEESVVNIPRTSAMSLYLMTKMPRVRDDLVSMGISEEWIAEFEQGNNVNFTPQDYQWMQQIRDVLDTYAEMIAPVYERLTGRPFRKVDAYYMVVRYMHEAATDSAFSQSGVIDAMLGQEFQQLNPANSPHFKSRTGSKNFIQQLDTFYSISRYAQDMNHFLAYADYADKLKNTFGTPEIKRLMEAKNMAALSAVIEKHIEYITRGNAGLEQKAMRSFFVLMSQFARNKIAAPKNFIRQLSAIAAALQLKNLSPKALIDAALDMPRAIQSGDIRKMTDASYFTERHRGMYEFAVQYAQDIARAQYFSAFRDKGPLGKARQWMVSEQLNQLITGSARYGDRWASVLVSWAAYRESLKKTGNQDAAISEAVRTVEMTQQSLDPSRLPNVFQEGALPYRLLTIFGRTKAIYFDQYIRAWENMRSGQMSKKDFIRVMLTYHVWIPLFEVWATSFEPPWETKDETLLAMALGPLSMVLLIGNAIQSIAAGIYESVTEGEAELPAYLADPNDSNLIETFGRDLKKAAVAISDFTMVPDWEMMWTATKAAAKVGDVGPVPTGVLAGMGQGIYDLLMEGPDIDAFKRLIGVPESRLEEK